MRRNSWPRYGMRRVGVLAAEFEQAPLTTVMELTRKTDGGARMLHWVNYKLGTQVSRRPVTAGGPGREAGAGG